MKERLLSIERNLKTIADILMFYGNFIPDPGLSFGKMGIAIFQYHYARYSGKEIYSNFSDDLMDQIMNEIGNTSPGCFQKGMAGIGWGIEYLVRSKFIEADTDEALEELDERIYNYEKTNEPDQANEILFFGQGLYFLARVAGRENETRNKLVQKNKERLHSLFNECEKYICTLYDNSGTTFAVKSKYDLSIFYFLHEIKRLKLFEVDIRKLTNDLKILSENIQKKTTHNPDLFVLRRFSINAFESGYNVKENKRVDYKIKANEIVGFPFLDLVYQINIRNDFYKQNIQQINIQKLAENKLQPGKDRNIGLQNGLAGLGMALMKSVS